MKTHIYEFSWLTTAEKKERPQRPAGKSKEEKAADAASSTAYPRNLFTRMYCNGHSPRFAFYTLFTEVVIHGCVSRP